jgi:hypothetical protein
MSIYARAKRRQRILFGILIGIFIAVVTVIGPFSNKHSSDVSAVLSFAAIGGFVLCGILLGTLGLRCPHCQTFHNFSTMTRPPQFCAKCGGELKSWYDDAANT